MHLYSTTRNAIPIISTTLVITAALTFNSTGVVADYTEYCSSVREAITRIPHWHLGLSSGLRYQMISGIHSAPAIFNGTVIFTMDSNKKVTTRVDYTLIESHRQGMKTPSSGYYLDNAIIDEEHHTLTFTIKEIINYPITLTLHSDCTFTGRGGIGGYPTYSGYYVAQLIPIYE